MIEEKIAVPRFEEEKGFYTTEKHSRIMSKIQSNSIPEIIFKKALWKYGIRYRLNNKKIFGKPDLVIIKHKIAIFIDGDFWHGHEWHLRKPKMKTNKSYWIPKIERNMQRDLEVTYALQNAGWIVIRLWEHQVKKEIDYCINKVSQTIKTFQSDIVPFDKILS